MSTSTLVALVYSLSREVADLKRDRVDRDDHLKNLTLDIQGIKRDVADLKQTLESFMIASPPANDTMTTTSS